MSLMEFLAYGRKERLAQFDAMVADRRRVDAARAPGNAVQSKVYRMIAAANVAPVNVDCIVLGPADEKAIIDAQIALQSCFPDRSPFTPTIEGARLFGIPVKSGAETEIETKG